MIRSAEKYIKDVLEGRVLVSKITRQTFERHERDLLVAPDKGWYFDKKAAEKVFDFCCLLRHSPDKRRWVPFVPEPWQAAIMYIVFGWKKRDGNRRFNYAYVEVPKKNGKTTFAAVVANYLLFFDGEEQAEVYIAATVEKQADICFSMVKTMINKSPDLLKRAKVLTNNVSIQSSGSKMEKLGRDSDTMEGINPAAAIVDELHVWKNLEVLENIASASVNRSQPLIWIITTSGRNKDLPCYKYRGLCLNINAGVVEQDDTFAIIYTLDKDDDWMDEKMWRKANPNYGVSVNPDRFKDEFISARNSTLKEVSFKTKNLNLWVDSPTVWIADDKWVACKYGITDEDLIGQECYAGLDLASHIDLNSLALHFPNVNGRAAVKWFFWVPESKVKMREDLVDYAVWVREGWIIQTPGEVIDIDQQVADIMGILSKYDCKNFAFDPAKAYHGTIQGLIKAGISDALLDPYAQGIRNMTAPTKEFERLVVAKEIDHMGNPVARWMMRNVVIRTYDNDNVKPDKEKSIDKIDGIIAELTALGGYMSAGADKGNSRLIYQNHTLRFI